MERRKTAGKGILRMVFVAVALIVQIAWILLRIKLLNEYSETIAAVTRVLTVVVILKLNGKYINSAMKMPWIMLLMAFPIMGLCMYLLFELLGDPGVSRRLRLVRKHLWRDDSAVVEEILGQLSVKEPAVASQFRYLWKASGYPLFSDTKVTYYPEASDAFLAMKGDLEKAEKYIFMEYLDRKSTRLNSSHSP